MLSRMDLALLVVACFFSVLALVGAGISLALHKEATDTVAKMRHLELDMADLVDRVTTYQKRDASRSRAVVKAAEGAEPEPLAGKAQLRAVARQRGLL